jgi:ribosomal protein S18 acetylase RimI-like enzyme
MVRNFHVHPEHVGLGIGIDLWKAVHSFLREQRFARATVDVIAANSRARRFFEARGFRLVRVAPRGVEGVPIAIYQLDVDGTTDERRS